MSNLLNMKAKYLLAAFCCAAMLSCQNNDPVVSGGGANLYDGLGAIVETQTLPDGTQVMKDSQGNVITKDKDGNTIIVTSKNDSIFIDNSINENPSAPRDKWYNSTWYSGSASEVMPFDPQPGIPEWIQLAQMKGFRIDQQEITSDTTMVEDGQMYSFSGHFRNTIVSLEVKRTETQYTYTRTRIFTKYTLYPDIIGNDEEKFELVIDGDQAILWRHVYAYNYETGTYVLDRSDIVAQQTINPEDNSFLLARGGIDKNGTLKTVGTTSKTTFYNYRRLSDTQLVASNNSAEYILKESVSDEMSQTPMLEIYKMGSSTSLLLLELVSYK